MNRIDELKRLIKESNEWIAIQPEENWYGVMRKKRKIAEWEKEIKELEGSNAS